MDRRKHVELQIRAVLVSLRAEGHHRDSTLMGKLGDRARAILDSIASEADRDPRLAAQLRSARRELDRVSPSPRSRFGEQSVDRREEFLDREGLH